MLSHDARMTRLIVTFLLVLALPSLAHAQKSRVVIDEGQVNTWVTDNMSSLRLPSIAAGIVGPKQSHYLEIYGKPELHQPYLIGSLSKSVTAMAVLLLVEDGTVSLDDPASKWVDGVPQNVTVEALLHQTSGLQRGDGIPAWVDLDATVEDAVAAATFDAPRDQFHYSNLNYQILGRIVEKASGESYGDFVHDRIFEPLEMRQSHAHPGHADNRVVGHQYMFGFPVQTGEPDYNDTAIPSGFVWMSANDMATWLRVHLSGGKLDGKQVIPAAVIEQMLTAPDDTAYAMGWLASDRYNTPVFSHAGAVGAFTAAMAVAPDREFGVFVLTNVNSFMALGPANVMKGMLGSVLQEQQDAVTNIEFIGRLIFGVVVALILLTFIFETMRWIREKFPMRLHRSQLAGVAITVFLNIAAIAAVIVYFETPIGALLKTQPDLGWGFLILTVLGSLRAIISGFI